MATLRCHTLIAPYAGYYAMLRDIIRLCYFYFKIARLARHGCITLLLSLFTIDFRCRSDTLLPPYAMMPRYAAAATPPLRCHAASDYFSSLLLLFAADAAIAAVVATPAYADAIRCRHALMRLPQMLYEDAMLPMPLSPRRRCH